MDIHQPKLLMEAYYGVYASDDSTSEDLYEQVADFLISEGYAEDLEDAIDLIEELDDEEIEGILDEVWGRGKVDPMYGTHNRSDAIQSAGGQAMRRTPYQKMDDKLSRTKALNPTPNNQRRVRKISAAMRNASADLAGQHVQKNIVRRQERERFQNEELDVYDLVLDHLLDEGYADSEQDALQIMSNMSEEWVNDILEAFKPLRKEQQPGVIKANKKAVKDFAFHASKITRHSPLPGQPPRNVTPAQKLMLKKSFERAKKASKFGDSTKKALEGRDPKPRS